MSSKANRDETRPCVSPQTDDKRDQLRDKLQSDFREFHRLRRRRRKALVVTLPAVLLVLLGSVTYFIRVNPGSSDDIKVVKLESPIVSPNGTSIVFEIIGDDEMLDLMAEAGKPSALVWRDGKALVVPIKASPAL